MSNGPAFRLTTELHIAENLAAKKKIAQFALDQQVIKDANMYVPEDTGNLKGSALLASPIGEGKVIWNTPYARRLYYNPEYNFSKDKNPNAQGLWFEAAKARNKAQWIKLVDNALKS
jgi:hypothetical protein